MSPRLWLDAKADLGEGPLWSARDEAIYWTNIKVKRLNRYRLADGATQAGSPAAIAGAVRIAGGRPGGARQAHGR
jgi:sugar lactone lactonase YvrE